MPVLLLAAALELLTLVQEIERAQVRGDRAFLENARDELLRALPEAGVDAPDNRYALAYADYRLATLAERGGSDSERYLKEAEKELQTLLKERPADAEAHALYATVNGNLITGMWSGMRRGPRAGKAFERAKALAPENPRVAMQEGSSRLFRPGFAGGGVDKAEAELTRALELFAKEPEDSPWPNWGRAEIHAWLGLTFTRKGDYAAARSHLEKALELEPSYAWVKGVLLPELKAAESAKQD
jgi:tetratricopeptide (TPR) repeat protein